MSKTHRVTRIAIITGIAIPSMMPRVWVERPFGAGGGEDEAVGDCRVDSVVGEDNDVPTFQVVLDIWRQSIARSTEGECREPVTTDGVTILFTFRPV